MSTGRRRRELSRVEQIRARRKEEQEDNPAQTASVYYPRPSERTNEGLRSAPQRPFTPPPPPVIGRGEYSSGIPLLQKSSGKPRRHFYFPLGATGAEIRLPALPNMAWGWRIISGSISLILIVILFLLWESPFFRLGQAQVIGADRIDVAEVLAALDIQGMQAIKANPTEIATMLQAIFPELSKVVVSVYFPANLSITVTERVPLLSWEQDGTEQWIDKEGYAFSPRGEPGADLVHIKVQNKLDNTDDDHENDDAQEAIQSVTNSAGQSQAKGILPFISTDLIDAVLMLYPQVPDGEAIVYSPNYGLGWTDPQGWTVYFGKDLGNMDEKIEQYETIVSELTKRDIKPTVISVEYLHAPFYRSE